MQSRKLSNMFKIPKAKTLNLEFYTQSKDLPKIIPGGITDL